MIDRYVYTGKEPLPDPDIIQMINHPLKLAERGPTKKRVLEHVVDFVATYIRGIAASLAGQHSNDPILHHNLACCECQLGDVEVAKARL